MCSFARTPSILLIAALGLVLLSGCEKEESISLFDPDATYRPQPTITSVTPAGSAVAGVDTIIIQGTNFSSDLTENSVYFNAQAAELLTATTTEITLKAPLVINDSVGIKVAVSGAVVFSNTVQYQMLAAMVGFGGLLKTELSSSIATDTSGNLYAGFTGSGVEAGIYKYTLAGVQTVYAPPTTGASPWTCLKFGPGGYLYAARSFRAIYRYPVGGGGSATLWGTAMPLGTSITDFDFDADGNMWAGGNNTSIYCIKTDASRTTFPFTGNVRSVRVYSGYLYFAARTTAGEQIWRAPVTAGSLGTPEVYFDFATAYPGAIALGITFSSDGVLYIGTDTPDGIVAVQPSLSYQAPYGAYSASFGTGLRSLAWGSGTSLFVSTSSGSLLKFTVRGKSSAPYYGATL